MKTRCSHENLKAADWLLITSSEADVSAKLPAVLHGSDV